MKRKEVAQGGGWGGERIRSPNNAQQGKCLYMCGCVATCSSLLSAEYSLNDTAGCPAMAWQRSMRQQRWQMPRSGIQVLNRQQKMLSRAVRVCYVPQVHAVSACACAANGRLSFKMFVQPGGRDASSSMMEKATRVLRRRACACATPAQSNGSARGASKIPSDAEVLYESARHVTRLTSQMVYQASVPPAEMVVNRDMARG